MKIPIYLAAAVLAASPTQAQTVLFRDDFTRANNTNLNALTAGQTGALAPLNWVEINCDGGTVGDAGTAEINGNQLRIDAGSGGGSGAVVYPDQNFTGLTSLTVIMNIDSGASGGDGRATGFGIGYTKSALDGKTSASLSPLATGSDVFLAYDTIGTTKSLSVRNDNVQVFTKAIPVTPYPVEYKIVFTFADMNDGTAITYEVFENGLSIYNGSTTWTGTNENYIGVGSNYTTTTDIEFIEIQGTLPAAPNIVKANNTDDLNLGTSWVLGTAPASGELAVWDSTVTSANTTVLGADVTWGGIKITNPTGLVTVNAGNTLTLDGLTTAIDLSTATEDLALNCGLALSGSSSLDVATGRTLTLGGVVSGGSGLTKVGDGTVILSGANTYGGTTSVDVGTLQFGASNVIPDDAPAGNVVVAGTLDLNGNSDTIKALTGSGIVDNTAASTTSTLSVGDFGQSGTFSGTLQNSGSSATLNLEKIGAGTLTLTGANTYSGSTTVSGGTLEVGSLSALGNTSGVSLADGTAFVPNLAGFTTSAPFTLGAASTTSSISVPIDGGTMTLNGVISGDGNLVFTDFDTFGSNTTGVVLLGAANTYTGTTTIATGAILGNNTTVWIGIANALPTTTVLSLEGLGGQGGGRSVTFDLDGNNQTLAGLQNVLQFDRRQVVTSTGAATLTVNNAADFSFGGVGTGVDNDGYARIQGAISLVKSGAGIFSLAGTNTNTGNTTINQGELRIGNAGTTGILNPATDITIASGATFGVNRSNAVVQGTDFSSNPLTGDGNFAQRGTGSTTLNLANTYNGTTTVDGGALVVAHASALGTTAGGTVVNGSASGSSANARLDLSGGVTVTGESLTISGAGNFVGALTSSSGSNVWAGPVTIGLAQTRLGASAGASLEVSGVIDSGAVTTGLVIRATDMTSTVILSGANTYLGTTQVIIGKLQLDGGDNRLPIGNILTLGSSGTNPDAEFDLNGRNQEVAGLNLTGSGVPSKNSVNNSSVTPSTLTVNTAAPFTYAGILKGNLAITKTGPDTLFLTGTSNVHTGATTITGGTLALGASTALSGSSAVSIGTATLGVGAAISTTTTGTLDCTGTATINLGDGTSAIAFADSSALNWTGTLNLTGTFVSGASLRFGDGTGAGLSAGQLSQITAAGFTGFGIDGSGFLTATTVGGSGFDTWKTTNSATGGLDDDHDGDGVSNGVEYFIGGPNGNTTGFTPLPGVTNTSGTLSVTFTKANDYTGVYGTDYVVETSATLANPWAPQAADPDPGFTVTFPSATEVKYTFPTGVKNFARLKVTGP